VWRFILNTQAFISIRSFYVLIYNIKNYLVKHSTILSIILIIKYNNIQIYIHVYNMHMNKKSILHYISYICYMYYNQRYVTFFFKPNIAKRQKHLTRKRTVNFILSQVISAIILLYLWHDNKYKHCVWTWLTHNATFQVLVVAYKRQLLQYVVGQTV